MNYISEIALEYQERQFKMLDTFLKRREILQK